MEKVRQSSSGSLPSRQVQMSDVATPLVVWLLCSASYILPPSSNPASFVLVQPWYLSEKLVAFVKKLCSQPWYLSEKLVAFVKKLCSQSWYLSERLVAFALFDRDVC